MTHDWSSIRARLGKDGARVLCGVPQARLADDAPPRHACSGVVATVVVVRGARCLRMPDGYVERGGIWQLGRHEQRRVDAGHRAARRLSPGHFRTPMSYPTSVRCPACGTVQSLDAARLGVVVAPTLLPGRA
jgi:hypothetical protein